MAATATANGAPGLPAAPPVHYTPGLWTQLRVIGMRSIRGSLSQKIALIGPIVFPLLLLTINSSGLAAAVKQPGFPTKSFLDFALVIPFMQGSLFATTGAGLSLGRDIEGGFLDRLALTPTRRTAIVLGQLAGAGTVSLISSCVYLAAGLIAGVDIHAGVLGAIVLVLVATLTGVGFASIGTFIALRTGSAEGVQGLFPLLFAGLFLSDMNVPIRLIQHTWFRDIVRVNPVTYLIGGMRSLIITGWDWSALGPDLGVVFGLLIVGIGGSAWALRGRLART